MFIYPIIYPLFIAFYSAIVFEGIMPGISTSYTRDYGDVLAYFLGGIFYYYVHQRIIFPTLLLRRKKGRIILKMN